MAKFWKLVNEVIEKADILLEVIDSRMINETRNLELEKRIAQKGKRLILVLNKCDLVSKEYLDKKKKQLDHALFISSLEHYGTTMLRNKILSTAKKSKDEKVIVGVVGYPNTGKSSLINALKGQKSAKASSQSGYTKALQLVKCDNRIYLIDTPGVIPFDEKDEVQQALISAIDPYKLKDPDVAAMKLIEMLDGNVEAYYMVKKGNDSYDTLEQITIQQKKKMKGNKPDIDAMARQIIQEWQKGNIRQ